MVIAHFKEVEVKLFVLVPVTFVLIQFLAIGWTFERGNRRIALRTMHVILFIYSVCFGIAILLMN